MRCRLGARDACLITPSDTCDQRLSDSRLGVQGDTVVSSAAKEKISR